MSKRRVTFTHRNQRSILTDMLPFEVPPTFSNRGFYRFLLGHDIEIQSGHLAWTSDTTSLDPIIKLLFGIENITKASVEQVTRWGKRRTRRSIKLIHCRMGTIPFNFRVAHKADGRTLSVIHPRNQIEMSGFYASHAALITHYTSRSEYSIRHPVSVSRYAYFKDRLHEELLESVRYGVEEEEREYEQLGSYFVYRKYRNIHRFFESYKYHRCEKKYDAMVQVDITKCFDSMYTHSLPWAVFGKPQTKFNLQESTKSFAGNFDSIMQALNNRETNGIVIGPEFSRIFAEVILQATDLDLLKRLDDAKLVHRRDYEIFRYVDDYFIFYNEKSTQLKIIETLQEALKENKLSINSAKVRHYEKPIITEITVAKEKISKLLNDAIVPEITVQVDPPGRRLKCSINTNRLIISYKTAIKEAQVDYGDLLNYTFAITENKLDALLKTYSMCDKAQGDKEKLVHAIRNLMEFAFFAYSASPKVNHTIRICRMVTTSVDFLNASLVPAELKHLLYKYVHDNIVQQLDKNTMGIYREIESLYLLCCLSKIGREYWLPEITLARHFLIQTNQETGAYERFPFLNHFSITVLLSYLRDKVRYHKLRAFIEKHAIEKLMYKKAHCPNDAEAVMLFLDLIVCPYISDVTKQALAGVFDLNQLDLQSIQQANNRWFTAWDKNFDLGKELDAKRSREVY